MRSGTARVPIVPGAILFDLLNGGDKDWGRFPPYRELGYAASGGGGRRRSASAPPAPASARPPSNLKGGVGSASAMVGDITVGALVAVNAAGSVTVGRGPWFWAAPYERDAEFGGHGLPSPLPSDALAFRTKGRAGENTTLAVVATDATLNKVQAKRLAIMAQVGFGACDTPRAYPARRRPRVRGSDRRAGRWPIRSTAWPRLGAAAADVLARAIARAVYEATALPLAEAPCRPGVTGLELLDNRRS